MARLWRRRPDPLGTGVWRRAHDRFRRAVDRYQQLLERLPPGAVKDRFHETGAGLAVAADEVYAVCVAAQRLAPSETEDVPGSHGGALLDTQRALARGGTLAAQASEAVMLAIVALRGEQFEEASRLAEAAARAVGQAAAQIGQAQERLRAVEQG